MAVSRRRILSNVSEANHEQQDSKKAAAAATSLRRDDPYGPLADGESTTFGDKAIYYQANWSSLLLLMSCMEVAEERLQAKEGLASTSMNCELDTCQTMSDMVVEEETSKKAFYVVYEKGEQKDDSPTRKTRLK